MYFQINIFNNSFLRTSITKRNIFKFYFGYRKRKKYLKGVLTTWEEGKSNKIMGML